MKHTVQFQPAVISDSYLIITYSVLVFKLSGIGLFICEYTEHVLFIVT